MRGLFYFVGAVVICTTFANDPGAPNPRRTAYNESEAFQLVNLASAAYGAELEKCINNLYDANAHHFVLLVNTTTVICDGFGNYCSGFAVVNTVERRVYIVFRGTKTWDQLLVEGVYSTARPMVDFYGAGLANQYFKNALEVLWPRLSVAVTDPAYANFPITFTGHSLGAAIASLASLKCAIENCRNPNVIRLINFGQPRVGNIQLATTHNNLLKYSFRVVHANDIVPHLPGCAKDRSGRLTPNPRWPTSLPCDPTNTTLGYHHGVEIWYPYNMTVGQSKYIECLGAPFGEDFQCSDAMTFPLDNYNEYFTAHRFYFNMRVPSFGVTGCIPGTEDDYDPNITMPPNE
uniref:Lipase_3 domain-containing protein n=1 Tax=Panagrellus redivivus TaxID=6233 RepID=A0A7E4ZWM9_PANRE